MIFSKRHVDDCGTLAELAGGIGDPNYPRFVRRLLDEGVSLPDDVIDDAAPPDG